MRFEIHGKDVKRHYMGPMNDEQTIWPAEWAPQRAIYTAFPSHPDLWEEDLQPAQREVADMVRALSRHVAVVLLADGEAAVSAARHAVGGAATVLPAEFGDIWLRDTGPIFRSAGRACRFAFNGWGGKYILPGDTGVGGFVAGHAEATVSAFDLVLEGGAIDGDGEGLLLTTEQCLLHPNRNKGATKADYEALFREALGVRRTIWLGEGLAGDHTDGHVDNLARFIAPGAVLLPEAMDGDDPNARVYADAADRLRAEGLRVERVPSVGRYEIDGEVKPASYMNFVMANDGVVVPLYGGRHDDAALGVFRRLFPGKTVTGLGSEHILTGGGSFHCITQQQPKEVGR